MRRTTVLLYGLYVDVGSGGNTNNIIIGNSVTDSGIGNYNISGTQITRPNHLKHRHHHQSPIHGCQFFYYEEIG